MSGVLEIILERDGHDQPWGFRLQGGNDVGMPLSVQRVLVGTPSEGVLKRGDVLIKVNNKEANYLSHQNAVDSFTKIGNQITLQILRDGSVQSPTPSINSNCFSPLLGKNQENSFFNPSNSCIGAYPPQSPQYSSTTPLPLTIQNQPYRTSPLIQPSVKVDLGPGSPQNCTGQRGKNSYQSFGNSRKINISMSSKAYKPISSMNYCPISLQNRQIDIQGGSYFEDVNSPRVQSPNFKPGFGDSSPVAPQHQPPTALKKLGYNSPLNLYSNENVADVARLNMMGLSGLQSPTPPGRITPVNKPTSHGPGSPGLPTKYNPEDSATWQAIRELENCQLITQHGPRNSKLYSI